MYQDLRQQMMIQNCLFRGDNMARPTEATIKKYEPKLQEYVSKMGYLPGKNEIKEHDPSLNWIINTTGGLKYWANKLGVPYGKKYECEVCGKVFHSPKHRMYCSKCAQTANKRYNRSPQGKKIRPYSWETDMLLIIDIDKGWDYKKVARVNALALDRDYDDVLKHIKVLEDSDRAEQIRKVIKKHR